jgi:apolipoprotein N-acyltransferase
MMVSIWLLVMLVSTCVLSASLKWVTNARLASVIMNIALFVSYGFCAYFSGWILNCVDLSKEKEDRDYHKAIEDYMT